MDKSLLPSFIESVVKKMEADTQKENRRLSLKEIKAVLRNNFKATYPTKTDDQIDELVEQVFPFAMRDYRTPQSFDKSCKMVEATCDQDRLQARKAAIRANRKRRR